MSWVTKKLQHEMITKKEKTQKFADFANLKFFDVG